MRLVMIGCGGFIGSHLLDRLLKDDSVFIEGWDPQTAKIAHHLGAPNLRLHRTTIQDPVAQKELRRAVGEVDAVIMLAAICNPSQYNTDPLRGTCGSCRLPPRS